MKLRIIFFLCSLSAFQSFSQPRSIRKMPNPVNQSGYNSYAPYISLDGNTLVFLNDYTDDGSLALQYCKRTGADWSDPVAQARNFSSMINYIRGFTLSPDGQTLFITSQLSNGVGGFDIYSCALKGSTFSTPTNLGLPVNSKGHDSSPTISADGSVLFFMRCDGMTSSKAEGCKILMSRRQAGGRWGTPEELPASINTGNAQSPRIMADGETLIFASNKHTPTRGGMDLYETRWNGQAWSNPVPLDFVNTAADDQYVSATAQGLYLLRDTKGERKSELVDYLFPPEVKPRAIQRIDGKLEDATIAAYVSVTELRTNRRISSVRPSADGSFTVFLPEGGVHEVAVEPERSDVTFSTRRFDLTQGVARPFERYTAALKPVAVNTELDLNVQFAPYTSNLEGVSARDLQRLSRLIKGSPALKAELQVLLVGYVEDSLRSGPDLTEMRMDSVEYYYDEIDSLGQLYRHDTLVAEYTYHNDRTVKQAEAIVSQLVSLGCDPAALGYFTNARPEAILEDRRTVVRVAFRKR